MPNIIANIKCESILLLLYLFARDTHTGEKRI